MGLRFNSKTVQNRLQALLPDGIPRYVRIYDNGGKTADRYTVVFTGNYKKHRNYTSTYLYLSSSEDPFHPQGVGQHGDSTRMIDRPSSAHLGKRISFTQLTDKAQRFVVSTYADIWELDQKFVTLWRMKCEDQQAQLKPHDKKNFETFQTAFKAGHIALMSLRRKDTGKFVGVLVATKPHEGEIGITPFAEMMQGNPFEIYEAPFKDPGPATEVYDGETKA